MKSQARLVLEKILETRRAFFCLFFLSLSAPAFDLRVSAMGCLWQLRVREPADQSFDAAGLEQSFRARLLRYEKTLSDWAPDSELRLWEKTGLDHWHQASKLLSQSLELSDEAQRLSQGAFDPTVGAVVWKISTTALGWTPARLESAGDQRRFGKNPGRLTFDGLAKGMLLGEEARELWENSLRDFWLDAGGGNLAWAGSLGPAPYPAGPNEILFLSSSSPRQGRRPHIFDPRHPRKALIRPSQILCRLGAGDDWTRWGALSDAISTARVVQPGLPLPSPCRDLRPPPSAP